MLSLEIAIPRQDNMDTASKYLTTNIFEILNLISKDKIFLPPLQRKFVWNEEKICKLLESVYYGFPIGTLYFNEISKQDLTDGSCYKFKSNFDPSNKTQEQIDNDVLKKNVSTICVLDGQQRITSFLIAIEGVFSNDWRKRKTKGYQPIERQVAIDFKSTQNENQDVIQFVFIEPTENNKSSSRYYFLHKIHEDKDKNNLKEDLREREYNDDAINIIDNLIKKLKDPIISYWWSDKEFVKNVSSGGFDSQSELFIRLNSGVALNNIDLLFASIANNGDPKQLRKKFECVSNESRELGFSLDILDILKSFTFALGVNMTKLSDYGSISPETLENEWEHLTESLIDVLQFLKKYYYDSEKIRSKNAIIPIFYARYCGCNLDKDSNNILKFIKLSIAKRLFSSGVNNTLDKIRDTFIGSVKKPCFPLEDIKQKLSNSTRNITITKDDCKAWLSNDRMTKNQIVALLGLLQPETNSTEVSYDVDHLIPKSGPNDTKTGQKKPKAKNWIDQTNFPEASLGYARDNINTLGNYHLLEESENRHTKSDLPLFDYLVENDIIDNSSRVCNSNWMERHYIPQDVSLKRDNFEEFHKRRTNLLRTKMYEIFELKGEIND